MKKGTISRIAARLSLGLSLAFLALLAVLHVLEPEFNSGHLISEYQLGDYGFLMSLAFCLLGTGALLLALSLRPRLRTRGERVGWWGLLVIGTAFFIAGVFSSCPDPRHHRLPARRIRPCRHFRLADCVHFDRQKPRQRRRAVFVVPSSAMGDAYSVVRPGGFSCLSHQRQSH